MQVYDVLTALKSCLICFQSSELNDAEDKLKLQLSEMEEENEVMEFRVLELEDANEKVTLNPRSNITFCYTSFSS